MVDSLLPVVYCNYTISFEQQGLFWFISMARFAFLIYIRFFSIIFRQ